MYHIFFIHSWMKSLNSWPGSSKYLKSASSKEWTPALSGLDLPFFLVTSSKSLFSGPSLHFSDPFGSLETCSVYHCLRPACILPVTETPPLTDFCLSLRTQLSILSPGVLLTFPCLPGRVRTFVSLQQLSLYSAAPRSGPQNCKIL